MRKRKALAIAAGIIMGAGWGASALRADVLDDIGYTTLRDSGRLMAGGAGISVAQVEAYGGAGDYAPDRTNGELTGRDIIIKNGGTVPSAHATIIAQRFYGATQSAAPNVDRVDVYRNDSFLEQSGLNTSSLVTAPANLGVSVINNSWIGSYPASRDNLKAVRRLDYMIGRDKVVVVNAADNGDYPVPKLLASSYNGITVGLPSGSSHGPMPTFDGASGRSKPDLVAPSENTSRAAGLVSGCAALLISEAKARNYASNDLSTKAILLAGAEHLDGWHRGAATSADDKRQPLDYIQGAGQVRIDQSFRILTRGRQLPNHTVGTRGWDTRRMTNGSAGVNYFLTLTDTIPEFSAALTWRRQIAGPRGSYFDSTPTLKNLRLLLSRVEGTRSTVIASSDSLVDNVETISLTDLAAGRYKLSVRGDGAADYGLAWLSQLTPSVGTRAFVSAYALPADNATEFASPLGTHMVPEPTMALALMAAAPLLLRRRRR